jgi:sensor histidine kinase YesM
MEYAKKLMGVMDTGPGIDLEKVYKILRGEGNLRGVGLYNINQRLIKMYNRTLHIEHVPFGGTNIYMYIPGGNVVENCID